MKQNKLGSQQVEKLVNSVSGTTLTFKEEIFI